MPDQSKTVVVTDARQLLQPATRRSFLRVMGVGGAAVFLPGIFTACRDEITGGAGGTDGTVVLDLSNDTGILNYAYALEQLEAAFYIAVVNNFAAAGITAPAETSMLTEIRNHEVIHREFLKAALGGAAIGSLEVDFGNMLATRANILNTAKVFEDLGVSAYNGAGKYLTDVNNLLLAGKIVSVEARHAAAIRDILDPTGRDFAGDDVVDENGLDVVAEPAAVLAAAGAFITTDVSIGTQPA